MPLSLEERVALRRSCEHQVEGFIEPGPAQMFRDLAHWMEKTGAVHDRYGEGKLIADFETKIASLLGKASAAFMPSGTMAQLIALRIWSERAGIDRFGMHTTAHPENHEEKAYSALLGLDGMVIGDAYRSITAEDVKKIAQPLACLMIEVPMREIGGQLLSWEELESLKRTAHERQLILHMDGARLWESRAFYKKSYAQIAEGFDSVYVSMYKGVGAVAGALLLGDQDFIDEARIWRRRMGGTLVRQSPMVASAAMLFDTRIAAMDACYARTLTLANLLNSIHGIRTLPRIPQSNLMHVFFERKVTELLDARDVIAKEDKVWLLSHAKEADVPGWCRTEFYIGDAIAGLQEERLAELYEKSMSLLR